MKKQKIKKFLCVILFSVIMSACQTNKVIETKITLPPMPERRELNENLSEIEVLIYYESLVQKFELWGEEVNEIIEIYNLRRDAVKEKQ